MQNNPHTTMSEPSWLPAEFRSHPAFSAIVQLADTIATPVDGSGFLPVLISAIGTIRTYAGVREVPDLPCYLQTLDSFVDSFVRCPNLPSQVRALPDLKSLRLPYQVWLIDPADFYAPIDSEKINSLLGLLLLEHLVLRRQLVDTRAAACITLIRAGRSKRQSAKPWTKFIESLVFHHDRLEPKADSIEHEPLRELLEFLGTAFRQVVAAPALEKSQQRNTNDAISTSTPPTGKPTGIRLESQNKQPDDIGLRENPPRGSLVLWQYARAQYAPGAQVAGLVDWNLLQPRELRRVTHRLAYYLSEPDEDNFSLAALAVISLVAGLPPRHALDLPLEPNDDVWVDPRSGCVCWSRAPLIKLKEVDAEIIARGHNPSNILRVPLPGPIASHLARMAGSNAHDIRALLFSK